MSFVIFNYQVYPSTWAQRGIVAAATLFVLWIAVRAWILRSHRLPYPPGPPVNNFLSGNLRGIPASKPWVAYTQWKKIYGDIVHLRIYGQHTIILNSSKVNKTLLEHRPRIYSDRPRVTMVDLMEWDFNAGLMPYGDAWRRQRRIYQQSFRIDDSRSYRPIQTRKVLEMLQNLLTTPDNFREHFKTMASASIISVVYGYDIKPTGDQFVKISEGAVDKLSGSVLPGAKAVNALPLLKYLPAWFPGCNFHRYAQEARELTRKMRNLPFEFVSKAMEDGTATPSIVSNYLSGQSQVDYQLLKDVAATSYAAGSDTTASVMGTFFLTMAMYPEVQKKAQRQIDSVTGGDRLATLDDLRSLPYIEAIFREILRWRPVTPLGVAHCTYAEDIYEGYYIPKGAMVLTNIWAICHDPEKYDKPEDFNPERYFDEHGNLNDDEIHVFGFGRRICPGRHFASATIQLSLLSILSVFNISTKKDANGEELPLSEEYTDGLVSHPFPFELSITPRSAKASQLILEASAM